MGAPGMTSPIRPEGFENLQLNAGVFIKNFSLTNIYDAAGLRSAVASRIRAGTTILGMTTGGGAFTLRRETRMPDADGRRYRHKGAEFVDSIDAQITSTLIEIVQQNWQNVLGTAELDTDASGTTKKVLKMHTAIDPETDYLTNIVWVGDIADGRLVAIELSNALNTSDITFTFQDKNEGKLPFEMHAHQDNVRSYDTTPVQLHFFGDYGLLADSYGSKVTGSYSLTMRPPHSAEYEFNERGLKLTQGDTETEYCLSFDYQLVYSGDGSTPAFSPCTISVNLTYPSNIPGGWSRDSIGTFTITDEGVKHHVLIDFTLTAAQAAAASRKITFSGSLPGSTTAEKMLWNMGTEKMMLGYKNQVVNYGGTTELRIPAGGEALIARFDPPLNGSLNGGLVSDYKLFMKVEPVSGSAPSGYANSYVKVDTYETETSAKSQHAYTAFQNPDANGRRKCTVSGESTLALLKIRNTGTEAVTASMIGVEYGEPYAEVSPI